MKVWSLQCVKSHYQLRCLPKAKGIENGQWNKSENVSCSVVSDSLWCRGLEPARLLCPCNSLGRNSGVGSHCLLQGIFPAQRLNLGLLHCRQILYHLSDQGSPWWKKVVINPSCDYMTSYRNRDCNCHEYSSLFCYECVWVCVYKASIFVFFPLILLNCVT